jgi:predicted negative regulator of RcsB-dependent stress response
MAYDLEEQEQLATLKAWWKDNGTLVLVAIAAAAIAFAGWQGWSRWKDSQSNQAATLYEAMLKALVAGDAKAMREPGGELAQKFPGSLYASMGALAQARFYFDRSDLKNAKAQLQWALEHSGSAEVRDVARLRLAGVLVDEKSYDEALKLLEAKHSPALEAQYAALRGDALVAKNRPEEAKAAYRAALEKADSARSPGLRESVQIRLDALGG